MSRNGRKLKCAPNENSNQPAHPLRYLHEETLHPWLSKMRLVKSLIRLRECAGWSESSLSAQVQRYVFCRCGSNTNLWMFYWNCKSALSPVMRKWPYWAYIDSEWLDHSAHLQPLIRVCWILWTCIKTESGIPWSDCVYVQADLGIRSPYTIWWPFFHVLTKGDWLNLVHFPPSLTRQTTFLPAFCLLSSSPITFGKGVNSKRKKLLPLPFKKDPF